MKIHKKVETIDQVYNTDYVMRLRSIKREQYTEN